MYTPVSARETGGVMSTVLIPTRFVWAYGGRSVFLTGSFNGWAELLPMSPVEGCPTVFQVICRLMPGYHEYKFFVDGQWRNDENQPLVNSSYGMVNSVFRDREGGYISTNTNQQMVSGSNMDVDTMAFRRMVRISESAPHEVVPRITETDLADTRQRIAIFLSGRTVYEMLPDSGKVIALDIQLPVKQAFHILFEQGISVAPLWDFSKGQFVGVLSSSDFILILREIGSHGSNMTEEELETHTISAWKEGKAYMNRLINDHIGQFRKHLIHAGPYENLRDVTKKIMQNGVATIPVIHSNSEDGSFPQLLHLASLSGILKCICRFFKHSSSSLPILELPVYSVPLGTWAPPLGDTSGRPLAMLRPTASLSSALKLLVEANVSSIPVVDENNSLLDIYSRSDITALAKDRVYANINLDEMTLQQALQLVHNSYSPYEYSSQRCQMCLRSDSLYKVMERLSNPGLSSSFITYFFTPTNLFLFNIIHFLNQFQIMYSDGLKKALALFLTTAVRRLVVVEAGSRRVEGIVSLSDIFRLLLR